MKRHSSFFFVAVMLAAATSLTAQGADSLLAAKYDREAILVDGFKNQYSKDHVKHRIGIFGMRMAKEFEANSPESKAEYQKYCRKRRNGIALMTTGGVALLTLTGVGPLVVFPAFLFTLCTGLGTYSTGAVLLSQSRRNLQKAVWIRNKEVLVKN